MDIKLILNKIKELFCKYKFAIIILSIGLVMLLIPNKKQQENVSVNIDRTENYHIEIETLSSILQSVEGAGRVEVMLSLAEGEKTVYQTNNDISGTGENERTKIETVIITDAQRNETGVISQINPPKYLGAIVVCQGADSPTVKLAITQAVAKITGLGSDSICVLKMK